LEPAEVKTARYGRRHGLVRGAGAGRRSAWSPREAAISQPGCGGGSMTGVHLRASPVHCGAVGGGAGVGRDIRYGDTRRREALAKFGARPAPHRKRPAKRALVIAAVALMVLAIARPVELAATAPSSTGDVVFLLTFPQHDFARCHARPPSPRQQIVGDIAGRMQRKPRRQVRPKPAGQRWGLIAFAGNAAVLCADHPTSTIPRNAGRASRPTLTRGGSRIGEALRFRAQQRLRRCPPRLQKPGPSHRCGDQDSGPQQAGRRWRANGSGSR